MDENVADMSDPEGWWIWASPGIEEADVDIAPVPLGDSFAPEWFFLDVATPSDDRGYLQFRVLRGEIVLVSVSSWGIDTVALLDAMRKKHTMTWWKRKALYELTLHARDKEVQRAKTDAEVDQIRRAVANQLERVAATPIRKKRRLVDDKRLQEVASIYKAAVAGGSASPTRDVFNALGGGRRNTDPSYSHVAHLVVKARKNGLIDPVERKPK